MWKQTEYVLSFCDYDLAARVAVVDLDELASWTRAYTYKDEV